MKKLLIVLLFLSCEKKDVIDCYTCNMATSSKGITKYETFRECGKSAEEVEAFYYRPILGTGNSVAIKCRK